jgi:hypothetical protein
VFCFPTWCFGLPAMLKGFFDRLLMPGVAFDISDPANVKPMLTHIKRISPWSPTAARAGWPGTWATRRARWSRATCAASPATRARADYHAYYHMNVATEPASLLGAIDAMLADRVHWTPADVRERATRGLQWAWECGTTHVRTHVDWWEPESLPMAWPVMAELAQEWAGKVRLEQVSLIKLPLFEDAAQAMRLAKQVKATGPHALLGGFVHSTNWSENALRNLLVAAQACDLDIDLHVDEELNAAAVGLQVTARILREIGYEGRVVCGHICALAAQPEAQAFATLDAVARAPITVVSLPATNLLLQDAVTGRTPRQRGITLVKEARERGIPLLFASDNVQDPFCRLGSFDPVEALGTAALVAQLDEPFDTWSQALCRGDWLRREHSARAPHAGRRTAPTWCSSPTPTATAGLRAPPTAWCCATAA